MQKLNEQPIVLRKDDYEVIRTCLRQGFVRNTVSQQNAEELQAELKRARVVSKEDLPPDVVRLNSLVRIRDEKENKILEVRVVIPENADIKQRKISILSPMGTALIGFSKGREITWNVPAGKKTFTILDVANEIHCHDISREES